MMIRMFVLFALFIPLILLSPSEIAMATTASQGSATLSNIKTVNAKAINAEEILWRVDRNLQPESSEIFFQVINKLPNGRKNHYSIYAAKGRDNRAAALIIAPDTLQGRAIMRIGDEVWMHIPGEVELRDSSLDQSLVGGVFNNADILMGDFSSDYTPRLLEERKEVLLLELMPRSKALPYSKVIMEVDRQLMLPLTVAQYDVGGSLLKTLSFQQVSSIFGIPRPEMVEATSELNRNYSAVWRLGSIKPREFAADALTKKLLPEVGILIK